jgi:hypothetical protein
MWRIIFQISGDDWDWTRNIMMDYQSSTSFSRPSGRPFVASTPFNASSGTYEHYYIHNLCHGTVLVKFHKIRLRSSAEALVTDTRKNKIRWQPVVYPVQKLIEMHSEVLKIRNEGERMDRWTGGQNKYLICFNLLNLWRIHFFTSCCMQPRQFQHHMNIILKVFFKFLGIRWDWVHLVRRPLTGLLYQHRIIDDECGAVGGMRIGRGNRSTRRKPAPVPLCPPQIPHYLTWTRTRAAAVGSRVLTAWAMARPSKVFLGAHPCDVYNRILPRNATRS